MMLDDGRKWVGRGLSIFVLMGIVAVISAGSAEEQEERSLKMTFFMRGGTGDLPMAVAWVEGPDRKFIGTVQMFSVSRRWYPDLAMWSAQSRKHETPAEVDAVTRPTIRWNQQATVTIPVRWKGAHLLEGDYVLRIESVQDRGRHFRTFAIPLGPDFEEGVFEHNGYISKVEIEIVRSEKEEQPEENRPGESEPGSS